MLLQNSKCLENVIVKLLTQAAGGLTAQEILESVGNSFRRYSRRGIYKELQRLLTEGIIIRVKAIYALRLAWIVSLQNEVELLSRQTLNIDYLQHALPTRQKAMVINCNDLVVWDKAWTQLMLVMHIAHPKIPMFIWCPRHWFTITHPEIENVFAKANESKRNIRYAIIGGRSVLDYKDREILARKSTVYSYKLSPFEYDRTHYYWIIGDYFGVCTIDTRTANKIDQLYSNTKKISEITQKTRDSLLSQKIRGTVRCDWAPEKAEKMRQKFVKFFGLKLNEVGEVLNAKRGEI